MQNDQTTSTVAPQESHDDSLVEDYVSNDQAEEQPNEEEVNSETTEHQKTAVNDEKSEDSAQAQNRKTARTITDQGKDGAKDEYIVAGQKYSSFDDAVKAVNKISVRRIISNVQNEFLHVCRVFIFQYGSNLI
jgi:hypothetical protein